MARGKKWTIPFMSLRGISCRVDIYKEGYSGDPVELSPNNPNAPGYAADDCFYYEENHDDDILNNVIQYRTGYIRLIELSNGSLQDLYPTTIKEHYVEFYFGQRLDFTGYMQVQSFSEPWVASPREISFPIISPLGLLGNMNFSLIYPPVNINIGELVDEIIDGLNAAYTRVVVPNISVNANLSQSIFSLFVSPWNEDYHHSINSAATDVFMRGETYLKLMEGICKAYGWVCHDTPGDIVFSMFDYINAYYYYPVGHVGDLGYYHGTNVPYTEWPLTYWFTPADNNAGQSLILPYSAIRIEYEGDGVENMEASFDRTSFVSVTGYGPTEKVSVANLTPITNEIQGAFGEVQFDSNNHVSNYGSFCVAHEGQIGILSHISDATPSGTGLFTIRHYFNTALGSWAIDYECMSGDTIASLTNNNDIKNTLIQVQTTVGANYIDATFTFNYAEFPDFELVFITNIVFQRIIDNKPYADFQTMPTSKGDEIADRSNQPNEASVTMSISPYRLSMNTISNSVISTKITEYPYLFRPRTKLVCKFRGRDIPNLYHTMIYSFWLTGWRWRIMALAFHPWDDEYTLTINRSSTIET